MDLTRHSWVFQPPLQPDCACTLDTQPPDYLFKIADSGNELLQAFHLLYQEYRSAGYVQEKPDKLLFTRHHLLPDTMVFVAKFGGDVVATASLVRDCHQFGLPMDDLYGPEVDTLRAQGRKILEVCSLAANSQDFSRHCIRHFTKLILFCCIHTNIDDVCIMINPRHRHLYHKRCGFEIFGQEKHYPRVNAPAIALRADAHQLRGQLPDESCIEDLGTSYLSLGIALDETLRDSFGEKAQPTHRNPVSQKLIDLICNTCTDAQLDFPSPWLLDLAAMYPDIHL